MVGSIISTALSGLAAATKKVEASASNIANIQTSGSLEAGQQAPYTPITTQQTAITDQNGAGQGVRSEFTPKEQPFTPAFDPDSPFANADGIIGVPNVNLAEEAVNLIVAELSYKANIQTIKVAEELSDELLSIFDEKA